MPRMARRDSLAMTIPTHPTRLDRVRRQVSPAGPFNKITAVAHALKLHRITQRHKGVKIKIRRDIKTPYPTILSPNTQDSIALGNDLNDPHWSSTLIIRVDMWLMMPIDIPKKHPNQDPIKHRNRRHQRFPP
jgi:hypothetical protein